LTVKVTALPADAAILLANGATAVKIGRNLDGGAARGARVQACVQFSLGQLSDFAVTISDPPVNTASATATLAIAPESSTKATPAVATVPGLRLLDRRPTRRATPTPSLAKRPRSRSPTRRRPPPSLKR
jgi:hypothetical protein